MNQLVYSLLHVLSIILLTAFTFQAFAAPTPENRKRTMMLTGILSLVALVAGFGLLAKLGYGFPGWVVVKLVCWLGLSAMAGMAFRAPSKTGVLTTASVALLVIALYAVYYKPF
jgi:hypothetical protein